MPSKTTILVILLLMLLFPLRQQVRRDGHHVILPPVLVLKAGEDQHLAACRPQHRQKDKELGTVLHLICASLSLNLGVFNMKLNSLLGC